jgi:CheY-like chemotaxis protein
MQPFQSRRTHTLAVRATVLTAATPRLRARILLSDDDAAIRTLYAALLADYGFEVLSAPDGDGQATLELAQQAQPHLLLTDRHKPGLDGVALRAALRAGAATAHLPILMVSTYDALDEPQRAGGPFDDFLLKPFPLEHLIYRLAALLPLSAADHDHLVTRAQRLPCCEHSHPITGLPGLHSLARRLGEATAAPDWAALALGLVDFTAHVHMFGRADAEGLLAGLGALAAAAAPGLLLGHIGFDPQLVLVGPQAEIDLARAEIVARFAEFQRRVMRMRPALIPPQLLVRHTNSTAGRELNLSALRAALVKGPQAHTH